LGTIVEIYIDENGITWPESVAPFQVHLIDIRKQMDDDLYKELLSKGIEVLYDDRSEGAGTKFKDSDLIGIPMRVVLSDKLGENVELKYRNQKDVKVLSQKELFKILNK